MFSRYQTYIFFSLVFLLSACNKEYRQIQKSMDSEKKYDYAVKSYESGDYTRAIGIFEDIQPFMRGRENFEQMTYTMAYAYFKSGDFFMASHVFQNYTRLFSSNEKVEECFFMSAYCSMLDIPYYKLDQSSATNAIKQFQLFINYYPQSPRVKEANTHIDNMRAQLARKAYELANNYFRRQLYLSASVAFKNTAKNYPETQYREEAMYMNIRSLYYYAYHSVPNKQVERYTNTLDAYNQLQRAYPESEYLEKVKNQITATNDFLEKHQSAKP